MKEVILEVVGLRVAPGQRLASMLTIPVTGVEMQLPIFLINGIHSGPTLAVTAGIHGAEYASVEAALRLGRSLDPGQLSGQVIVVPIANPSAFAARSIYITPADGKNLNRQFPGLAHGTFTQVLAHWLFTEIIAQSDAYVDLHGGDMIEALVPFVLHYRSDDVQVDEASARLARAFGIRYILQGSTPGSTYAAASQAGIPAVLAEAGGQGIWNEETVGILSNGLARVLAHSGMLDSSLAPAEEVVDLDRWAWLRADVDGLFYPIVDVGETVVTGQNLGRVADVFGATLQQLNAPLDGVILFLVSSLAMNSGDPLLAIAA